MHLGAGLYGGLEHAAGTMLLEDPKVLPAEGEATPPKDYIEFLTLAAHEYFHAWLVKRLNLRKFILTTFGSSKASLHFTSQSFRCGRA